MESEKVVKGVKSAIKLVTQAAAQMALGGLSAAVIPANICMVYKVAYFVGTAVLSGCVVKPVSHYLDEQFEEADKLIDETKKNLAILAEKEIETSKDKGD